MKRPERMAVLTGLAMIGQLGINIVLPPLLLTLLGVWLTSRYDIGVWLTITLLVVGLVTAACGFYRFALAWLYRTEDKPGPTPSKEDPHEN